MKKSNLWRCAAALSTNLIMRVHYWALQINVNTITEEDAPNVALHAGHLLTGCCLILLDYVLGSKS